jgi:hypothetical protein
VQWPDRYAPEARNWTVVRVRIVPLDMRADHSARRAPMNKS